LKFKIDENLPTEYAPILREAGFEADTVSDEKLSGAGDAVLSERCRAEDRVLMTLDLDFANVQAYPPKAHPGIVVFRSKFPGQANACCEVFGRDSRSKVAQIRVVTGDRLR
jgi:predicted nuclease of predicted toxin-antitoxin system